MQKVKSFFGDSLRSFYELRSLAMMAMLLAAATVLGLFSVQITESIKISFADIPIELAGLFFGPVAAPVMGALADILKYLVAPTGPFFPGFTISGLAVGFIHGMMLYKRPLSIKRVIISNVLVTVLVNMLLNTFWLSILYGNAYMVIFPARIAKEAVMCPLQIILFYAVARVLTKINNKYA